MTRIPEPRPTLTARCPEDLLAMVPVSLGFHPERSLVMLTFGRSRGFQARVDLPDTVDDIPAFVELLLEPALRHRISRVVFIVYSTGGPLSVVLARSIAEAFVAAGVEVLEVLRAEGGRWHRLEDRGWSLGEGYDVRSHRFVVESVVRGEVTHASRGDLAESFAPDADRVARLTKLLSHAVTELSPDQVSAETAWVVSEVARGVRQGKPLSPKSAGRLLVDLTNVGLRDEAWFLMTRDTARSHLDFWSDLTRTAPAGFVAAPATLAAFAAWLAGHGALSWCALDRCFADDPAYSLARTLADGLMAAVPPSTWDEVVRDRTTAHDPA